VVGGLAVAQQVRFRQGRIGALALFLQVKKATWRGGGEGVTWTVWTVWWWRSRSALDKVGSVPLLCFLQVKKATLKGGGG
jgi:hypothetical protein